MSPANKERLVSVLTAGRTVQKDLMILESPVLKSLRQQKRLITIEERGVSPFVLLISKKRWEFVLISVKVVIKSKEQNAKKAALQATGILVSLVIKDGGAGKEKNLIL